MAGLLCASERRGSQEPATDVLLVNLQPRYDDADQWLVPYEINVGELHTGDPELAASSQRFLAASMKASSLDGMFASAAAAHWAVDTVTARFSLDIPVLKMAEKAIIDAGGTIGIHAEGHPNRLSRAAARPHRGRESVVATRVRLYPLHGQLRRGVPCSPC